MDKMKYKVVSGISLAVALGAAAGGGLIYKPALKNNNVVYTTINTGKANAQGKVNNNQNDGSKNTAQTTNQPKVNPNEKIAITAYEFTPEYPYEGNGGCSIHYTHYSLKTGNEIKESSKVTPIVKAYVKDYKGEVQPINTAYVGLDHLKQVTLNVPVGSEMSLVQWEGYYSTVQYDGHTYMIPTAYLNLGDFSTNYFPSTAKQYNEEIQSGALGKDQNQDMQHMQRILTKDNNNNVKVIGTAVTRSNKNSLVYEPHITTMFNGWSYDSVIRPGTKVNLVDVNGLSGFTTQVKGMDEQYVEYNGIVGYMNVKNLTNINKK